jgi:hypothetical protein
MKGRATEAFETHTEVSQLSGSERPVAASAHIEMVDLRSPRCHSAWGPNADRRANSLNCPRKEGSTSGADSQTGVLTDVSARA